MAITKCRECSGKVSTEASTCPHCGAPSPANSRKEIEVDPRKTKASSLAIGFIVLILFFVAIGIVNFSDNSSSSFEAGNDRRKSEQVSDGFILTQLQEHLICRGATAALFGRPIEIVSIWKREGNVIYTKYVRPDDSTVWTNKFRIEGTTIIWGTVDGRWRTDPLDGKLSFSVDQAAKQFSISETHSDGSVTTKDFPFR